MYPIDFFWRAAQRFPDRDAIDASTGIVSYRRLANQVRALAAALLALDARQGTRVAICARNSPEHITMLLAVLACGKVWIPLDPKSPQPQLRRIVDATEPTILVHDEDCLGLLKGAPGKLLSMATVPSLCAEHGNAAQPEFEAPDSSTQSIKFTGGTTGLPKAVMQPYRAWMANIVNQMHAWKFNERDRYVIAAPLTHGASTFLLPVLAQGGCHVLPREPGALAVRDAFRDRRGTVCFMPPTLIYMLMGLAGATRSDYSELRLLIYGAAPMPPEKIREVRAFFGPVLAATYGQTEAPSILTAMQPEEFEDEANWGAVGRPTLFTDVAIMDPNGRRLRSGEIGEIVARGDLVMTGYLGLPEKTAQTVKDGWLHTGDLGLLDDRGLLYIRGRLKEMLITGGFNVYPVDVENALGKHPAVHECAVFGIPDEKWGEAVQAAVQRRPGHSATEVELKAFVRDQLGAVQTPKRIHLRDTLPRSSAGKVLKDAIRAELFGEASQGRPE